MVTVDGAEFVAGGAVLFLLRDGGEVGYVVGGRHGDAAHPEAGEGGVVVEEGVVLGVGVHEVEGSFALKAAVFDVANVAAEEWELEGMEEEGERGLGGYGMQGCVGVMEDDGGERVGGGVLLP